MMTQKLLPFQYHTEKNESGMTSFAGLPLYLDLAMVTGLCLKIKDTLQTKTQGWTDLQMVMSLILLNIVGGDCVDDIERLEADEGMRTLMLKIQTHGMRRKARRAFKRRWRKTQERAFPSTSAIHRYLEQFHHQEAESLRQEHTAFIPSHNELLKQLIDSQSVLLEFAQRQQPSSVATLDQDATLCATHKRSATYCYKRFKAYQPFNTYWAEQQLLVKSEFRDGNVNAGFEQRRLLEEALNALPEGVETVYLRSDSAGYQHEILEYCAEGKHPRFGVIECAIAICVSAAFKQAALSVQDRDWQPLYHYDDKGRPYKTNQEWAEVCFVPSFAAKSKQSPDYRYIAIREPLAQQLELKGIDVEEPHQQSLPFQTMVMNQTHYKLFGLVTNRTLPGNELIHWHRQRCGESEKVHSIEKTDLSGGQFPSNKFGANAAWWQVMMLAFNLNQLMKTHVLPDKLKKKRLKGLRFHIIHVAGRFIHHARGLWIKISGGRAMSDQFNLMREKIIALAQAPPAN